MFKILISQYIVVIYGDPLMFKVLIFETNLLNRIKNRWAKFSDLLIKFKIFPFTGWLLNTFEATFVFINLFITQTQVQKSNKFDNLRLKSRIPLGETLHADLEVN
uniref:Uncharacterized protein n=1 Tax=Glossina brevipalpis TaxID=37001 RepID=A0A1A9WPY5_9MUSC